RRGRGAIRRRTSRPLQERSAGRAWRCRGCWWPAPRCGRTRWARWRALAWLVLTSGARRGKWQGLSGPLGLAPLVEAAALEADSGADEGDQVRRGRLPPRVGASPCCRASPWRLIYAPGSGIASGGTSAENGLMADFGGPQEFTTWDGEPVSRDRPHG